MPNYDNWTSPDPEPIDPEHIPKKDKAEPILSQGGEVNDQDVSIRVSDQPGCADEDTNGDDFPEEEDKHQNAKIQEEEDKPKKMKKRPAQNGGPALSKKEKKLAKKKQKTKKKSHAGLLLQVLIFAVFAVGVTLQGMDRVEAANALIGSTALTPSGSSSVPGVVDTDPPEIEPDDEEQNPSTGYKYIDAMRLDAKTATDLAVWYLNEFAEGRMRNETEFAEFQDWYEKKIEENPEFQTNFNGAIAYYEAHPELLVPVEPSNPPVNTPEPEPTPDIPPGTVDPGTGSVINPQPPTTSTPSPSQPQPTPTPFQTNGSSTSTGLSSKYPNIDEEKLNGYTAAEVANWVSDKFPLSSSSWDYQALSDYYAWLEERGKEDPNFVALVNGYLQRMGWTASAG